MATNAGIWWTVTTSVLLAGALTACESTQSGGGGTVDIGFIPVMPTPMVNQALLAGRVLDENEQPVAGATVLAAETDAAVPVDIEGRYQLLVPADSTLTLVVSAPGFAKTYSESVVLAAHSMISDFDLILLSTDRFNAINGLDGAAQPATLGVMAIRLHSLSTGCTLAGAQLSIWPPQAGAIVYAASSPTGGLDQPDPALTGVQEGARISAWLVGALPPGNMLLIGVNQAGCALLKESPSLKGMVFPGSRRVDAQALSQADLFLDQAQ
jgi:hypothetical protein